MSIQRLTPRKAPADLAALLAESAFLAKAFAHPIAESLGLLGLQS